MFWNFFAVALAMLGTIGPIGGVLIYNVGSVLAVVNFVLLLIYLKPLENHSVEITKTHREKILG